MTKLITKLKTNRIHIFLYILRNKLHFHPSTILLSTFLIMMQLQQTSILERRQKNGMMQTADIIIALFTSFLNIYTIPYITWNQHVFQTNKKQKNNKYDVITMKS